MPRQSFARAAALALAVGLVAPALAQEGPRTFLTFEHEGISKALVDPRDMPLRDALARLPDRVARLPREIPDIPPELGGLLELTLRTVARPARVAITYDGDNVSGGFYGYGFIASIECANEEQAAELHDAISGMLNAVAEERGVEIPLEASERFEGMRELMLPLGPVSFGPRRADSGWRYELVVGTMNDADSAFAEPPSLIEARGFESFATASIDFTALTPVSRMAVNLSGANAPQVREIVSRLEAMGLVGEHALAVEYQTGVTADVAMAKWVLRGAAEHAEALSLATEPLIAADLAAIPADALGVSISKASLASIDRSLEEIAARGVPVEDALARFREQTGVDLVEDVLHALGGTIALYSAESTGGGSLLSTVGMIAVQDRERLGDALARLAGTANSMIDDAGVPGRYVNIDRWSVDEGAELISLRFPGVPVPLEITFALTEDWLIAALTPQAAAAAARQAMGMGDDGLASNPRFAAAVRDVEGLTSVSFVDTPRTLGAGYPLLSLASSAIANLVSTPGNGDEREIGMLLPLYGDVVNERARPTIKLTRWEGGDLVTTGSGDRCLWVQAGGELGVASAAFPLVAAGVGAAVLAANEHRMGAVEPGEIPELTAETLRRAVLIDPIAQATALAMAVLDLEDSARGKDPLRGARP